MSLPPRPPLWRSLSRSGLARYVVAWLAAGAVVVGAFLALPDDPEEPVTLPPIRQTQLEQASRSAGCVLRATGRRQVASQRGPALPAGVYDRPPAPKTVSAALRRGVIVVRYRPDLPEDRVARLRVLQEAVPTGTVLAPGRADARYAVTTLSFRQRLGCARADEASIEAIRLFRGRYLGLGTRRSG